MQNANEVKSHIRAVAQTRKITNALHLVSSVQTKKIMPYMEYNKLYYRRIQSAVQNILASGGKVTNPYLAGKKGSRTTFIVVSGDKGMVGSYNNDVLNFAMEKIAGHPGCHIVAVGMSAAAFFRQRKIIPDKEIFGISQDLSLHHARNITEDIFWAYDQDLTDRIYVIYTHFVNSVKWHPCARQLLPLQITEAAPQYTFPEQMIYHVSAQEVFNLVVPQYTIGIVFGALLNACASEHCSRMNAMQSATKNADELLVQLRSRYNLIRQAAITQEITEITSAAQALEEAHENAGTYQ